MIMQPDTGGLFPNSYASIIQYKSTPVGYGSKCMNSYQSLVIMKVIIKKHRILELKNFQRSSNSISIQSSSHLASNDSDFGLL